MSEAPQLPPVKVAFIIDNQVVDILHTDDRLGAIFLSEPVIKDVTDLVPNEVAVGFYYDPQENTFFNPNAREDDTPDLPKEGELTEE
jgi:hypothetical protein